MSTTTNELDEKQQAKQAFNREVQRRMQDFINYPPAHQGESYAGRRRRMEETLERELQRGGSSAARAIDSGKDPVVETSDNAGGSKTAEEQAAERDKNREELTRVLGEGAKPPALGVKEPIIVADVADSKAVIVDRPADDPRLEETRAAEHDLHNENTGRGDQMRALGVGPGTTANHGEDLAPVETLPIATGSAAMSEAANQKEVIEGNLSKVTAEIGAKESEMLDDATPQPRKDELKTELEGLYKQFDDLTTQLTSFSDPVGGGVDASKASE